MSKKAKQAPAAATPASAHHTTPPAWLWLIPLPLTMAVMAYLLIRYETEFLLRAQELNLWLPTHLFWTGRMAYPGGLASWLGCYLTQFFYYPWLGTAILATLWLAISLILVWAYRLRGPWALLSLLIPLALLACFTQTGYWLYYQKLQGHLLVPTVGILFATLALAVQRLCDKALPARATLWARPLWTTLVCVAGYPFFGAWALGATALLAATPPAPSPQGGAAQSPKPLIANLVLAIALIAIIPQLYYQQLFEMTQRNFVYAAALPSMRYGKDSFEQYRLPYYALILSFAIITVVGWLSAGNMAALFRRKAFAASATPPHYAQANDAATPGWRAAAVTLLLLAAATFGVRAAWYHDSNFEKELAMDRAIQECDWERVLTYARDGSSGVAPTRQIVMYKNLALFRLGRAGNEMFLYPEGSTAQNAPWRIHMTQVGGKLIYYHYGKENFCYRWCMEDGVEFGWRAETLKFMVRTSLLNREWEVARKYINILKQTTFHRRWAERYEPLLVNHDAFDLTKLEASVANGRPLLDEAHMREFAPIMHMMTYPDRLDGDNTLVEMYLLQTFAKGNGDDLLFQEMTLICALYMKDIALFWPRFMRYATLHPKDDMPRYYQEAAYLYGHLEDKVDISHMPFSQSVRDTYERFMKFNAQCGPMTEEQKAVAFRPQFGDTFYYFYFLVRNQKTN